jgi:hypothetical protein
VTGAREQELAALRGEIARIARAIASGTTGPREGAARIWVLLSEADYPEELHEAELSFVGHLSEWQDHPEDGDWYSATIVANAERYVAGLPR